MDQSHSVKRLSETNSAKEPFDTCSRELLNSTAGLDRDQVTSVKDYAEAFINTVREKYQDMQAVRKSKQKEIQQKNKCMKIESQILM